MHTETINKIKSALSDDNTTLINNELSERNAAEIASIIISFSQNDICSATSHRISMFKACMDNFSDKRPYCE